MTSVYVNTFGPHTRYEKRKPKNVYVGVRRNRFRSKSDFVEYSTSTMKHTIGKYTPVQIMNRSKDPNQQYPSKYNGITPAFGLDISSISTVKDYLEEHVADHPTADWTFFFIPNPTFLQIEQHDFGIEDENLAIDFKQLLKDNKDSPSFIVRNASVAPKYQYYNTDHNPDITDNPGWPSTRPISQGEDLIVKAQNGFQITVSNALKKTLTSDQIYTDFPLTIKKRKYKPRKHSAKKHSEKKHSIRKQGATKRKHSELKEGGAKRKHSELKEDNSEDNSIFYMYFLHLFFNIGKNRSLQDEHRKLFYIIIQNIYSRNQLENLKQKLEDCPHKHIDTSPWKKWIEEITPSTPKSHSRAISPMPVVVEPLRFKKQKTKSGGKKRRSYTRKYRKHKKHKSRFI
uniref:Uncharacterized protein n=1 Tax=Megaviridae environmental sample TaxID=1737588 RepID=A0A5J6VMC7_9VIRU|nr:MAG: hypothetical protein [Megaviridae environmental sample]